MNTIMKSIFAIWGLSGAVSLPLITQADTTVFSGKNTSVDTSAQNGNLYLTLGATESASKSESVKGSSSGAYIMGYYYDGSTSYYFYSDTLSIEFQAKSQLPTNVTASGSISGTWAACDDVGNCVDYSADTIQFSVNAEAVREQSSSYSYKSVDSNAAFKTNERFAGSNVPAAMSNSYITSTLFGEVTPTGGFIGHFNTHTIQITK